MAVGAIATSILTDIANAIRQQNGTSVLYKPREMAAAVMALDGSSAGSAGTQPYKALQSGVVSERVFENIADAIRGQNGESATYAPGDMADAILALSWDVGLKPRAVLLADGTLEFNYYDRRRSITGGIIAGSYDVSPGGYTSESGRAYHGIRLDVTRVVIDPSFASVGLLNADYLFNGFQECTEVRGFQHLSGITSAKQMFTSCKSLESIFATSFSNTTITSSSSMFYGCSRLVGGEGFVPAQTSGASVCKLGAGGVLTNPDADARVWIWGTVYDDGVLEVAAASAVDATRSVVSHGRLCTTAVYTLASGLPWYESRASFAQVVFKADLAGLTSLNMCYWFYSHTGITSFSGIGNLANVSKMRYAFSSCTGVATLDFRGFDPSRLTDLFYCFAGCSALTTIYADGTWALPTSGLSGSQCFYSCNALVGGAGTTWSSSKTSCTYMRVDAAATPGYLTVA
jgi:hypothetical protein